MIQQYNMNLQIKHIIILSIGIIIPFFPYKIRGEDLCAENYQKIHEEIKNDIENVKKNSLNKVLFKSMNIHWPDCKKDQENKVEKKDIRNRKIFSSKKWLAPIQECIRGEWDSFQYYKNMKNGDDWIVDCSDRCGVYAQVIDGRTTTFLIKQGFLELNEDNVEADLLPFLDKFIKCDGFNLATPSVTFVKRDSMEIIGVIEEANTMVLQEELLKYQVIFWVNEKYTIIDLLKKRKPLKNADGGYLLGSFTVGGIKRDDPRPFKRFEEFNINFQSEAFKEYPWLTESIIKMIDRANDGYLLESK